MTAGGQGEGVAGGDGDGEGQVWFPLFTPAQVNEALRKSPVFPRAADWFTISFPLDLREVVLNLPRFFSTFKQSHLIRSFSTRLINQDSPFSLLSLNSKTGTLNMCWFSLALHTNTFSHTH